jgi:S-adenosylmethionine hydrolase
MFKPRGLVAFISDFGYQDPYVGAVHAVVERVGGGRVRVVDVAHEVPAFNIVAGAYVLYTVYRYFPPGTVFLVVVDPGVGSERRPLAIITRNYAFVGPDNGVLWPAASEDGIVEARVIENQALMLKPVSASFHGRDIFAPVATYLAIGGDPAGIGGKVDVNDLVKLRLVDECPRDGGKLRAIYVDRFGNVALSAKGEECYRRLCRAGKVAVCTSRGCYEALCRRVFSLVEPGRMVLYLNSFWFLELAVNLGSAADRLGVSVGDEVEVSPAEDTQEPR